jgi:hypothetical protein
MSFAKFTAPITLADVGSLSDIGKGFPAGEHPVLFTKAEIGATSKDANSGKVTLTGRILDGEFKGVEGVLSFNCFHQSAKASEIGKRDLYKIAVCAGLPLGAPLSDLNVLGQRPVKITMAVQVDPETGGPSLKGYTEFRGVTAFDGTKPYLGDAQGAAQPSQGAAQPAQGGWGGAAQPSQGAAQPA